MGVCFNNDHLTAVHILGKNIIADIEFRVSPVDKE